MRPSDSARSRQAKKIALDQAFPSVIKKEHLKEYLGLPTAFHDKQSGNEGVGVVTGLAWTQMGGEILFVESSVSAGQKVAVLEAMKMENEIQAESAGTVTKIHVAKGDSVSDGTPIVTIA